MADKLFLENDMDYEASDSENEYTEREKKILKKVRKGRKKGNESDEEEVFAFDEDDSEPEKFDAASDFEDDGENDDGLPDDRAWGKKKSAFYHSDFQDQDYRGYTEKEEEAANLEQIEALQIQKRLVSELNEADFNLDMFILPEAEQEVAEESTKVKKTKTDLSDLSRKQKVALFKAEAPEFDGLVQDFEERLSESKNLLNPAMELMKSVEFPNHPFMEFIKCRSELILNYCTNISFYLMLKSKRVKVKNHPVVKRLIQFRQLICQLDDIFEYVVKPQIETLLAEVGDFESLKSKANSGKLKMLENLKSRIETTAGGSEGTSEDGEEVEKPLFTHKYSSESEDETTEAGKGGEPMEEDGDKDTKRKITKQIAKNKGLTAKKRREFRNPRVKNKLKFKKAVVRRKGAIRDVKSKVNLYAGEATGVKTHVKRGIKIK